MLKKLLSMLLVAAMLLSVLPMGIFAEETDEAAYAEEIDDAAYAAEEAQSQISISADGRTAKASVSGDGLVLTAIYDRNGTRMIAYAKGSEVTLDKEIASDGECVARAFLLSEGSLIPVCKYAQVEMGVLEQVEDVEEPETPTETPTEAPTEEVDDTKKVDSTEEADPTEAAEDVEKNETADVTEPEQEPETGDMTLEEAAGNDYMVLPEGAEVSDTPVADEMKAFSGKTSASGASRTTTFSGLMPGYPYQLVVTKVTGTAALSEMLDEDKLVYTNQKKAGSSGSLSFTYELDTREDVLIQLYGMSNSRSIHLYAADGGDLDQTMGEHGALDSLTLKLGETASYQLTAKITPAEWAEDLEWSSSDESILEVTEGGVLTPVKAGTAYVKATVHHEGFDEFSATCRVLVMAENQELKDVVLVSKGAALELYKTKGVEIRIHPQIGDKKIEKNDVSTVDAYAADEGAEEEKLGHLIQSAEFGTKNSKDEFVPNETMNKLFNLVVEDDWTLYLVPTDYAVENPNAVKKSYNSQILLHTEDKTFVTKTSLALSVSKSQPKLSASTLTINGFYGEKAYKPAISGATVMGISKEEAHEKSWPSWLSIDDAGLLSVDDSMVKAANAKVYLSVETKEWRVPATVQLNVQVTNKAPAVQLSAKSITLSRGDSDGVSVKLLSKEKGYDLETLGVTSAAVDDERVRVVYVPQTGELTFEPTDSAVKGSFKVTVKVTVDGARRTLDLPLTINVANPVLKLNKSSVTLNTRCEDSADVWAVMTPADARIPAWEEINVARLSGKKYKDAEDELDVTFLEGILSVSANENTVSGATYRVTLKTEGQKPVVLTVKTTSAKPSVTLKATGTLDLTYCEKGIKLSKSFKNMSGNVVDMVYTVRKNKEAEAQNIDDFFWLNEKGEFVLLENADVKAGDKLTIQATVNEAVSSSVTVTVKQTPIKVNLSKSSLTLNKGADQTMKITYTYSLKGDGVRKIDEPVLVYDEDVLSAEVDPDSQTILVSLGEDAAYGKTYKLYVRASETDPAAVLNVKVCKNAKVKISVSTSGTLDPIRDTKVYAKYSADGYNFVGVVDENGNAVDPVEVTVWASKNGKTGWEDVSDSFEIRPSTSRASTYSILKLDGVELDSTLKYRIRVDLQDEYKEDLDVTAGTVNMKFTVATCYTKVDRSVTVYRTDLGRGHQFKLSCSDKRLNEVDELAIADKNLAKLYEIESLGSGVYELRPTVTDGKKLKSVSMKLNVFVDGMERRVDKKGNEIPNGTVTLKVTVK